MSPSQRCKCSVLYIDNNANDHFHFQHAVAKNDMPLHIQFFLSGEPAVAFLRDEAPFAGLSIDPYPSFILCVHDRSSSKGDELIAAVRAFHSSAALPIIILSDSGDDGSVASSYEAGADHSFRRPTTQNRLAVIVRALYACAMSNPRNFNALKRLAEYQPPPTTNRAANRPSRCSITNA